jgi:hypothetical protein
MAADGRVSLDRVLALARLSLGRDLTPAEVEEAKQFWSERRAGSSRSRSGAEKSWSNQVRR